MSRPPLAGGSQKHDTRVAFRRRLLLVAWLAAAVVIVWRAAELQVTEVAAWRAEADRQHRTQAEVPAPRGTIRDRTGLPLALSHETFRVSVAPHEIAAGANGGDEIAGRLEGALNMSPEEARRVVNSTRRWVVLPGRYPPIVREELAGVTGVYVERELRRFRPHGELARAVLGVEVDGMGRGGVEQAFEEILHGDPGLEVMARDSEGRPIPGDAWTVRPPRSGGEVVLTLDLDLQEIAHEAIAEAVEKTGARSGDLLVTDPRSGEVLAMVSLKADGSTDLSALHSPYEPGSTLKPFTVAGLLAGDYATLGDSVDTGDGRWTSHGRTITDVQAVGKVTLEHALRVSSNVGIAKLAERLTQDEQYEVLRDFGFGVATGMGLPGEASGLLRRPAGWSRQSSASLAIGYEIGVTPLQMAMAYGALANGGQLVQPRIVREVRNPDGTVAEEFESRTIRRVIPEAVARDINASLVGAVEDGTGSRAQLTTFAVAGKSGTSRAYGSHGGYERGGYYASFIGFFPADDPQLLVFVKLERPQGEYYGGATAAPVTRATMEAVLAARHPPIDRSALARVSRPLQRTLSPAPTSGVTLASTGARPADPGPVSPAPAEARGGDARPVPEVRGLSPRVAARRLHSQGFRVIWNGGGSIQGTAPASGEFLLPGDTIRLLSAASTGPPGRSPAGSGIRNE